MKRTLFALAASALLIAPAAALAQAQDRPAQQPPAAGQPPSSERPGAGAQAASSSASGELVKVDADAKTLSIKSTDGQEQQFSYNEQTEVSGARGGVAGLATKAGSKVTIQFTESGGSKMATKIEVAGS
jgi:hypothetical protein